MDYRNLGDRFDEDERLDPLIGPVSDVVNRVLPRGPLKDALHGVPFGHPMHPLLTDLPIGFWTSAFVLDLVGGKSTHKAAERLIGLGVLSVAPTAWTGWADWSELDKPEQRAGLVHAAANATATALYAVSWVARKRGHRGRGVALAMMGAGAATVGGYLGGHLSFRRGAGVNHAASAPEAAEWAAVASDDEDTLVVLDGEPLFLPDAAAVAVYDRCSHLGGPLHEGEVVTRSGEACVRCPWHASTFSLEDGSVRTGPATAPQPAYDARSDGGEVQVKSRPTP